MARSALMSTPAAAWPLPRSSASAEPEVDRHKHQSGAVSDRDGERPEPELGGPDARQRSGMAPVEEAEDTEPDDQEAGADLDLPPPIDQGDQQRERQDHQQHREQMADRERPERRDRARGFLSIRPAETASGHPMPGLTPW